jgi:hypothetical protein
VASRNLIGCGKVKAAFGNVHLPVFTSPTVNVTQPLPVDPSNISLCEAVIGSELFNQALLNIYECRRLCVIHFLH